MKVFAIFNIKGGVGKTASAVSLAYLAAAEGRRTLLWDLDPQGATSFTLRTRPRIRGAGRRLILGDAGIDDLVRGSDFDHLDVVPADLSSRKIESALRQTDDPLRSFLEALEPVRAEYDYLFLDCAPTLSSLSETVFSAADVLLCPSIPTPLSLRMMAQLMKHLKKREGPRPLVLPFFCMVDRRKALHKKTCDWVAEQDLGFLRSHVPYSSFAEQMSSRRQPLFCYAPQSPPARAYRELWKEIQQRLSSGESQGIYAKSTRKALENAARNGAAARARDGVSMPQRTDR